MKIKIRWKAERYLVWVEERGTVREAIARIKKVLGIARESEMVLMHKEYVICQATSSLVLESDKIYDCFVIDGDARKSNKKPSRGASKKKGKEDNEERTKTKPISTKPISLNQEITPPISPPAPLQAETPQFHSQPSQKRRVQTRQTRSSSESSLQQMTLSKDKQQSHKRDVSRYYHTMKDIRQRIKQHEREMKITSIQDFVGGQVDYYFSPKNLHRDNFMRNSSDSQGWMDVSLLLKFPKITKLEIDQKTLNRYLAMYHPKHYQLNQDRSKIRRKEESL